MSACGRATQSSSSAAMRGTARRSRRRSRAARCEPSRSLASRCAAQCGPEIRRRRMLAGHVEERTHSELHEDMSKRECTAGHAQMRRPSEDRRGSAVATRPWRRQSRPPRTGFLGRACAGANLRPQCALQLAPACRSRGTANRQRCRPLARQTPFAATAAARAAELCCCSCWTRRHP